MTLNRALAAGFLLSGGWASSQPPGSGAQLLALILAVAWGYRIHRSQPAPRETPDDRTRDARTRRT